MDATLASMPIVDIDSHYTEPPDLWSARAPAKLKDAAPRVVTLEGQPCWVAGTDVILGPLGFCVVQSDGDKVRGRVSLQSYDEMAPAATHVPQRLDKLDERIEELKAQNKGLVDAFIGKLKEIIEILRNFKNR